uniref:CCHC-type domain-containing protein n=1 Tax=Erpetoichthys calabaricus TaxID=27687 RepID=A0A8C4TI29_ERPCA
CWAAVSHSASRPVSTPSVSLPANKLQRWVAGLHKSEVHLGFFCRNLSNQGGEVGATPSSGSRSTGASGQLLARAHACSGGRWSPKQAEGARRTPKVRGRRGTSPAGEGDTISPVLMVSEEERKNAVRFQLTQGEKMDRKTFVASILFGVLGFIARQVEFVFAFHNRETFEVVFTSNFLLEKCIKTFNEKAQTDRALEKVTMQPLAQRELKSINVVMFSERIKYEQILQWIERFCVVQRGNIGRDEFGIKTGYYSFLVKLPRNEKGELKHLPPTIQIGGARGLIFYNGQPKVCRKCEEEGHVASQCMVERCRNCGNMGHLARKCTQNIKCHLCGEENHGYKACPKSCANKIKGSTVKPITINIDSVIRGH